MKVLSEIGVAFQKDGTLAVDNDKLDKALATNLKGVANLFSSATGSTTGYGKQLDAIVNDLNTGALKVASDGVTSTIKELDKQYDAAQLRVDAAVDRYRKQFNQLDVLINSMNNTKNYLTQQFNAMSGTSNK
jgi:flagellar hook-associated protein 2